MISNILLMLLIFLILSSSIYILILYLYNKTKRCKTSGSELSLEILNDDNEIRLIESKDSKFSKYVIKRNMIKLSTKTYYNKDLFSCTVASLLAGYSTIKNKYFDILGKIFNNFRFITFSPIITIIINIAASYKTDAKIGTVILLIVCIYQYFLNDIHINVLDKLKEIPEEILNILNRIIILDKIFFISTLIGILRLVIIIIN